MLSSLFRFIKRVAVLLPVLIVAYVSVFNIFPWFNDHVPALLAVIITYALGAYVIVPAIIRLFRLLLPAKNLPVYSVTADGFASDPVNIAVIATRGQLRSSLDKAGWFEADKLNIRNGIRLMLSTVYGWDYRHGPISKLYLFGRPQDLAYQAPDNDGVRGSRHHVRFWAASKADVAALRTRSGVWQELSHELGGHRKLWVGAASRDIGVTFVRYNAQLTHLVDPNTDEERDLLVRHLTAVKRVTKYRSVRLQSPYKLSNIRGLRPHLLTDGRMTILQITAAGQAAPAARQK